MPFKREGGREGGYRQRFSLAAAAATGCEMKGLKGN